MKLYVEVNSEKLYIEKDIVEKYGLKEGQSTPFSGLEIKKEYDSAVETESVNKTESVNETENVNETESVDETEIVNETEIIDETKIDKDIGETQ